VLSRRCVPSSGSVNPGKMQNGQSTPTGSAILTRFCPAVGANEGYRAHEQNIRNGLVFRHYFLGCPKRFCEVGRRQSGRSLVLSYREHIRFALCIHRDFEPAGLRTGGGYCRPALHLWTQQLLEICTGGLRMGRPFSFQTKWHPYGRGYASRNVARE
jgi:hypothetical protein